MWKRFLMGLQFIRMDLVLNLSGNNGNFKKHSFCRRPKTCFEYQSGRCTNYLSRAAGKCGIMNGKKPGDRVGVYHCMQSLFIEYVYLILIMLALVMLANNRLMAHTMNIL
jgi:hypothetical protein